MAKIKAWSASAINKKINSRRQNVPKFRRPLFCARTKGSFTLLSVLSSTYRHATPRWTVFEFGGSFLPLTIEAEVVRRNSKAAHSATQFQLTIVYMLLKTDCSTIFTCIIENDICTIIELNNWFHTSSVARKTSPSQHTATNSCHFPQK